VGEGSLWEGGGEGVGVEGGGGRQRVGRVRERLEMEGGEGGRGEVED
jgi:hypothetical protein